VSNVHRLRPTDLIFFICVNLRPAIKPCNELEYALLTGVLKAEVAKEERGSGTLYFSKEAR
jgi:hypothetical protein